LGCLRHTAHHVNHDYDSNDHHNEFQHDDHEYNLIEHHDYDAANELRALVSRCVYPPATA
jgi:hypothetical protein